MSLRSFHLFFIAISVVLAAFVAAWAVSEYRDAHQVGYIAASLTSSIAGALLAYYGTQFQRKTRNLT
jgi:hypothetical protein